MCPEESVRGVGALVIDDNSLPGEISSRITFHKAGLSHTGTLQCRWRWGTSSECLAEGEGSGEKLRNEVGHSGRRSATMYVKVFQPSDYSFDGVVVGGACVGVAAVLFALAALDARIDALKKTFIQQQVHL